jgi:hypothetical protein
MFRCWHKSTSGEDFMADSIIMSRTRDHTVREKTRDGFRERFILFTTTLS